MERLRKNALPPDGNCLANRIRDDASASFIEALCPPGKLTNTVATAAIPSPASKKIIDKRCQNDNYDNLPVGSRATGLKS